MKITDTMISIPPYISTSWENVSSLYMDGNDLVIALKDGKNIPIKNLSPMAIEQIFSAHTAFLEAHEHPPIIKSMVEARISAPMGQLFALPFRIDASTMDNIGAQLQHNPVFAGLPPLPEEAAAKLAQLSKVISPEEILSMPQAEPNCNCMYCQINRILRKMILQNKEGLAELVPATKEKDEEVSDAELHFEQWEVELMQDKMYSVTNKLDPKEHYTVHLGDPIGCTCGKQNCEHIVAVLRS